MPIMIRIGSIICAFFVLTCLSGFVGRYNSAVYAADNTASDVAAAASKAGRDWPQFLGLTGDNKSDETQISLDWDADGPPVLWTRELGESYGIGSVSGSHYFQFDYVDKQAKLFCLDRKTGEPVWEYGYASNYVDMYNYNPGPRCSPVVDGNRVYIYGVEGRLACVNAQSGKLIWDVDTAKKFNVIQNFFGVGSTPAVFGDLLIVMVGGSPAGDAAIPPGQLNRVTGNGSGVVAFDKLTGKVRYQLSNELASYASPKIIQRQERAWCFMFMRGGLLAFDPATGAKDFFYPWRARLMESVNASNPVVWDDKVFISETYGPGASLLRFRPGGYEIVWADASNRRNKAMQTHWNTSIYHQGYLYGSSGRHTNNAELRCVEAATGEVKWSKPGLTRASLLYVKDHFVCLSEDGAMRLLAATPERYQLVRAFTPKQKVSNGANQVNLIKYPAWAAPILSHGLMYVRGRDRLVCYDLRP